MERKKPLKICTVRLNPNKLPKFQIYEMFDGVGRSIRVVFNKDIIVLVFRVTINLCG